MFRLLVVLISAQFYHRKAAAVCLLFLVILLGEYSHPLEKIHLHFYAHRFWMHFLTFMKRCILSLKLSVNPFSLQAHHSTFTGPLNDNANSDTWISTPGTNLDHRRCSTANEQTRVHYSPSNLCQGIFNSQEHLENTWRVLLVFGQFYTWQSDSGACYAFRQGCILFSKAPGTDQIQCASLNIFRFL